jgi:hypothetical protein
MLDFSDLAPKSEEFKGPDGELYEVRTASVDATVKYRNAVNKAGKWQREGENLRLIGFEDPNTPEITLVAYCVYAKGSPTPVGEEALKLWHGHVLSRLFNKCKEMSPWVTKADDAASPKASSGSTEASSS